MQAGLEARSQGQFKKAFENFHAAYESGDSLGEVFLGMAYMRGQGVRQDGKIAKQYFESVLRKYKGNQREYSLPVSVAFFGLAQIYEKGLGVTQSMGKALKFYKKIISYNGGRGYGLIIFGGLTAFTIITIPLIYFRYAQVKNLRVAEFTNAPMLKTLLPKHSITWA
ncbi:hypothetical protein NHP190012_16490 (plasmid) [Helicobacter sp. NHP19-012]|uniref:beta-lactamase n=1 Tax=Helicobacter gastrofelis TaxID=2849642 RepID=A0ABM7SJ98_9HELI|nr:hypothetical protein NHP190012_16490 [Helicobacter sp. NHP19-012]